MVAGRVESRNNSSFVAGIVTLLLVVIGSSILLSSAAAADSAAATPKNDEDAKEDTTTSTTCENTHNLRPQFHPQDETLMLYHYESTGSTQDEAKKLVQGEIEDMNIAPLPDTSKAFCVTASEQTNGRGTSGRQWLGASGNTFVTIGIPQATWMGLKNVPLTLLPLRIGSVVAARVQKLLDTCGREEANEPPMVAVKWPNDVLVDEKKISGVLIESSSNGWFLIGIGVNLAYAPTIATSGPNNGRPSTCIQDYCPPVDLNFVDAARQLGVDLAFDLNQWILAMEHSTKGSDFVLEDWKQWVDWDMELVMRDTHNHERVKMTDLLPDGRVQVVSLEDGRKRTLVSDYFL